MQLFHNDHYSGNLLAIIKRNTLLFGPRTQEKEDPVILEEGAKVKILFYFICTSRDSLRDRRNPGR